MKRQEVTVKEGRKSSTNAYKENIQGGLREDVKWIDYGDGIDNIWNSIKYREEEEE